MRVSAKGDYALRAVQHLALNYQKGFIRISDIAREMDIPLKFLERILLELKNAGFLESKRGIQGGYFLKKHPSEVTVAEIMRTVGEFLSPMDCIENANEGCTTSDSCNIRELWQTINDNTVKILEETSIEDICRRG